MKGRTWKATRFVSEGEATSKFCSTHAPPGREFLKQFGESKKKPQLSSRLLRLQFVTWGTTILVARPTVAAAGTSSAAATTSAPTGSAAAATTTSATTASPRTSAAAT